MEYVRCGRTVITTPDVSVQMGCRRANARRRGVHDRNHASLAFFFFEIDVLQAPVRNVALAPMEEVRGRGRYVVVGR